MSTGDRSKVDVAREYFVRADQGRADVLELLHDDVEIYFPKFGVGAGRASLIEMVNGFQGTLESILGFRDGRIASLHIYLDPDYLGEDESRFRWGKQRTW